MSLTDTIRLLNQLTEKEAMYYLPHGHLKALKAAMDYLQEAKTND